MRAYAVIHMRNAVIHALGTLGTQAGDGYICRQILEYAVIHALGTLGT